MEDPHPKQIQLIGRDDELDLLKGNLEDVIGGKGSTILISGEAGIGKTRLVDEFLLHAVAEDMKILAGSSSSDTIHPFLTFSKALEKEIDDPLLQDQEYNSFAAIFAIDTSGIIIAQASSTANDLDADIFADMLSAVQDFIKDSFGIASKQRSGLGRLEYGDMKIMIEHGSHLHLTAVFKGNEHPDMKTLLKAAVNSIEEGNEEILESWSGNTDKVPWIQEKISSLADVKFLIRRDLEGVKLENERIRIADEVLELLKSISGKRPLILLLEDLHWADESSLFVLNYLSRNIKAENIMIVGTLRPEKTISLQTTLEKMSQEENFLLLPLIQLGNTYVSSLVEAMYPANEFPEKFIKHLSSACDGNPFFVIELLRQMKLDGNISTNEGSTILISQDYSIPGSVDEMIQRRLENLDPESMALAEYTSCIGRMFESKAAMSIKIARDPVQALQRLQDSGIIIINNGTSEFCHAIFQDVIYKGIGNRWKSSYHKHLGEYYEEGYVNRTEEVLYDLAKHFSRSNEYEKGFDYCYKAGEKAENIFALEQAISFYKDSLNSLLKIRSIDDHEGKRLDLLERMGGISAISGDYDGSLSIFNTALEIVDDDQNKARILRKIGDVHVNKGEFDEALKILSMAKEVVEEGTAEYGRILINEANPHLRKGDFDKALPQLSEAIEVSEKTGVSQKDIGNALRAIGNIHWYKGDYDNSLKFYNKSLEIMENIGDKYGIGSTLNNIGNVHHAMSNMSKALEYFGSCLEIMEKIGGKQGIAAALNNMGLVYYEMGEQTKSLEFYERSLDIKEKIGDKQGTALSLSNIGNVHNFTGNLQKALEFYGNGLGIMESIGDKWGIALSLNNVGNVYHSMGDLSKSLELYEQSLEIRESIGDKHGIARVLIRLGNVHHSMGDLAKALEFYERSLKIFLEIGDKIESIYPYCGLAEVYIDLGKAQHSLENAEKAVENSIETMSQREEGKSRRILGMAHRDLGNYSKAEEEFEKAKNIMDEIGYRRELAKLIYEYALLYKIKDELDIAREYVEQALSMFEEMGMRLWAEKCRKVMIVQ